MNRVRVLLALLGGCMLACGRPVPSPADRVHARYVDDLDDLSRSVEQAIDRLEDDPTGRSAREPFESARLAYKRIEHLAAFHYPAASDRINGAPVDEVEENDGAVIRAEGFQVVEGLVYGDGPPEPAALRSHLKALRADAVALRMYADATAFSDANVIESVRRGLVRVFSLGLSGFDSGVALRSVPEAAAALRGMRATLAEYGGERIPAELADRIDERFAAAGAVLERADFGTLDRLAFLRDQVLPLHRLVDEARRAAGIAPPPGPTAWKSDVATPYDEGAFDPSFFSPAPGARVPPERIALGAELFVSPLLSEDGARTCATCHRPDVAFAEDVPAHAALDGGRLERNTPTLIDAGLARGSFHDLRTAWLEDQAAAVLASPREMGSSAERVAARLRREGWTDRFRAAGLAVDSIRGEDVMAALAAYVRSLIALDAPFDRYVRGEERAMTASQRRGFEVFMGKGKCGTCHFAPLFSGAVPPTWEESEVEVLGVPTRPDTIGATIDPDEGRSRIDRSPFHRHAFRTPTLRNVALTAPYMHNGVYATLEQVIDFYDRGGGAGIGIALENQTLPPERLELTAEEKRDLVAFMEALTDTVVPRVPAGTPPVSPR